MEQGGSCKQVDSQRNSSTANFMKRKHITCHEVLMCVNKAWCYGVRKQVKIVKNDGNRSAVLYGHFIYWDIPENPENCRKATETDNNQDWNSQSSTVHLQNGFGKSFNVASMDKQWPE